MSLKPICVLDACTIINLINIDSDDDFLIKKLEATYNLYICEKVIKEVTDNLFKEKHKSKDKKNTEQAKEIGRKISNIRKFIKYDNAIINDERNIFSKVKRLSKYKDDDGEFKSVVLSLYLSRYKMQQLTFYTDDRPARNYFKEFFTSQQIGKIEDSVDLLVFLYWLIPEFNKNDLDNLLSQLYYEYAVELKYLLNKIREIKQKRKLREIKTIKRELDELEYKLSKNELNDIGKIKEKILKHQKPKDLCADLKKHRKVFELESDLENNYFNKIKNTQKSLKNNEIFKIEDKL